MAEQWDRKTFSGEENDYLVAVSLFLTLFMGRGLGVMERKVQNIGTNQGGLGNMELGVYTCIFTCLKYTNEGCYL